MKKLLIITVVITLAIFSCKKETEVDATTVQVIPKSYISKVTFNEIYNNKTTRDQEFNFSYDSKGRLESIAKSYNYYDFNTGNLSNKVQNSIFLSYNSENLTSEAKMLDKLSNGNDNVNIDKFIYDKDKVVEIRPYFIENGVEKPHTLGINTFKYNTKGQLTSILVADEVRTTYIYTNDVHTSTISYSTTNNISFQETALTPISNFPNAQKIIISRILEGYTEFGYGLTSIFFPKKTVNGNTIWEYEIITDKQNFPTKVIRKNSVYNVTQTMNFEYKTF